jgi:hypothetical protein
MPQFKRTREQATGQDIMKTLVPVVLTALVAASPPAVRATDDAAATFLGNCLQEGPAFSRTFDKAKREE